MSVSNNRQLICTKILQKRKIRPVPVCYPASPHLLKNSKNRVQGLSRDFWNVQLEENVPEVQGREAKEIKVLISAVDIQSQLSKEVLLKGHQIPQAGAFA